MIEGTTMTNAPLPEWFDARQAAEHVGVHEKTIRRWVHSGKLAASRPGGRLLRIRRGDLEKLFEPPPPPPDEAVSALTTYRAAVDSLPAAAAKKDGDT